jgi:2-oxoglutarate ferredoxin oxidoreductase subunit gamma
MKCERIILAGAGGQGIVFLGKLIANAAIDTVPHITFFPSYGAEVRGGSSHCQVILSQTPIPSPVADSFDSAILMNQDSLTRFLPRLSRGGLALVNSSLCATRPARRCLYVPATQTADEIGDQRAANLVLLGVLLRYRPLVQPRRIEAGLRDIWKDNQSTLERNVAAFHAGLAFT